MKIGGFGKIKDYLPIAEAGYDFAELDVPEIADLSGEALDELQKSIKTGVPIQIGSRLLPVAEPLFFEEGFKPESLEPYLEEACGKTARLGIRTLILGNGKARWIRTASERPKEEAFIEALRLMARKAEENHQELILEPLGPKYSNYINTVVQAVQLIEKVKINNLFTMAELRHMVAAGEPFQDLQTYLPYIHHIHMDYPLSYPERNYPSVRDGYDYRVFLDSLERAGYDGTLTIEADIPENWHKACRQVMEVLEK